MAAETVPLWVTIATSIGTLLFGAGGMAGLIKAFLTYKTRGLELESEDQRADASLTDGVYQRLEASFSAQLQACYDTIAKHEERIQHLEEDRDKLRSKQWRLVSELDIHMDRSRRIERHHQEAQEALADKDYARVSFALDNAAQENSHVLRQTGEIRALASEASDSEEP